MKDVTLKSFEANSSSSERSSVANNEKKGVVITGPMLKAKAIGIAKALAVPPEEFNTSNC